MFLRNLLKNFIVSILTNSMACKLLPHSWFWGMIRRGLDLPKPCRFCGLKISSDQRWRGPGKLCFLFLTGLV
jgi:hypothetical protein